MLILDGSIFKLLAWSSLFAKDEVLSLSPLKLLGEGPPPIIDPTWDRLLVPPVYNLT